MDHDFQNQTHAVEDWHWWYAGRRRIIERAITRLNLSEPTRTLDAGCGSGRNLVDLARLGPVTGLEPAGPGLRAARERSVGTVVEGTLSSLPFEDDSFDLALTLDVIEHLDDDEGALRELRRTLRPGGTLLVTVPAYPKLWSSHDEVNHHRRRYTRRSLLDVAGRAGWQQQYFTHFNALLLPAAAGYRLLERVVDFKHDVSDLERTPKSINRALQQPLHLEAWMVAHGYSIPFGLSLLAIYT